MDSKPIIAVIIGTIVQFFGGFLIFGMALDSFTKSHTSLAGLSKAEPNLLYIAIGCLFFALLLTLIYYRWAGIKTAVTGAKVGAIIGLLVSLSYSFIMLGTSNMFDGFAVVGANAVGDAVLGALTGAAIGWWLGRD